MRTRIPPGNSTCSWLRYHFAKDDVELMLDDNWTIFCYDYFVPRQYKLSFHSRLKQSFLGSLQVEREHEEQIRLLKMKSRKAQEPPQPPKTITVVAGEWRTSSIFTAHENLIRQKMEWKNFFLANYHLKWHRNSNDVLISPRNHSFHYNAGYDSCSSIFTVAQKSSLNQIILNKAFETHGAILANLLFDKAWPFLLGTTEGS